MFLHTWHPHAILFQTSHLTIHWYGLTLALGALAGFFVARWIGRKYHLGEAVMTDLFLTVLIAGLIGARLYHVSNEWGYYHLYPADIIKVWNGGLAWHGGLVGGTVGLVVFSRWRKMSFWTLADVVAPALALGQAIGRWGNYFNQELFGQPTSLPWGIPIDFSRRPPGYLGFSYFHPTFLYESLGSIMILALIIWLHQRRWKNNPLPGTAKRGTIALVYLILAAGLRIATESLRLDHTPVIGNVRLPIISGLIIITAAVITWIILVHSPRPDHVA